MRCHTTRLVTRAVAAILAALVGVAACTSSGDGSGGGGGNGKSAALTFLYPAPSLGIDPDLNNSNAPLIYEYPIYDRLTQIAAKAPYDVEPMLAKSWTFGDGGKTLTMTLRSDVKFGDGTKFDASVVKANIERSKTVKGSTDAAQVANISSVDVVNSTTVRFNLSSGGADLPGLLALAPGMMINPRAFKAKTDLSTKPPTWAGTGAYTVADNVPNDHIDYVRKSSAYWDKNAAKYAKLTIKSITDATQRANAVKAGDANLAQINGTGMQTAAQLSKSGGLKAFTAGTTVDILMINTSKAPFDKLAVRKALATAIDRSKVVESCAPYCAATDQFYPKGHWAYSADLTSPFKYSASDAKQMLADAGYKPGQIKLPITATAGSPYERLVQVLLPMLKAAGFDASLDSVQNGTADPNFIAGKETALETVVSARPDPAQTIQTYLTGVYKVAPAANLPTITKQAGQAQAGGLSTAQRAAIYKGIFQTALDQAWYVPFDVDDQTWLSASGVQGVDDMPGTFAGLPDLRYVSVH